MAYVPWFISAWNWRTSTVGDKHTGRQTQTLNRCLPILHTPEMKTLHVYNGIYYA